MEETGSTDTQQKSPQKGITTVIAIVIIALLVIGGIIVYKMNQNKPAAPSISTGSKTENKISTTQTPSSPSGTLNSTGNAKEVIVSGKNFSFTPNKIVLKKGETTVITFKNTGGFHNFIVDELNIETPIIPSGENAKVTITPEKIGTFEFYCSVGNHRAMGMKGTLIVQ